MPRLGGHGEYGRLNGQQIKKFGELLVDAFDTLQSLDNMLLFYCNKKRQRISLKTDLDSIVLDVISESERKYWTAELLLGALEATPTHIPLLEFAQQFGLSAIVQPARQLERLVREANSPFDIEPWLSQAHAITAQICRIEVPVPGDPQTGTGFLLGPDVVITNYHVIEMVINGKVKPERVRLRFDFKMLADRTTINSGKIYLLSKDNWLLYSSKYSDLDTQVDKAGQAPNEDELDFAILRVDGAPGNEPPSNLNSTNPNIGPRKWVELPTVVSSFEPGSALYIMQHPKESPLKLAMETQAIIGVNENGTRVRYKTNTDGGSSGSPCFDANWQLVALHHSGDPDYSNFHKPGYNQGIPIEAIITLLESKDMLKLLG